MKEECSNCAKGENCGEWNRGVFWKSLIEMDGKVVWCWRPIGSVIVYNEKECTDEHT